MSDTDDTDDLLLIPPDFFTVHSDVEDSTKPYGPYYKVVDSLITQVNELQNRIVNIETASDSSFVTSSRDNSIYKHNLRTNLMSGIRKCNSLENIVPKQDVYSTSAHSTPQKPRTRLKLNSLPSTPSTDRGRHRVNIRVDHNDGPYSQRISPSKFIPQNQHAMLNEIDKFISNVKVIQKYHGTRNVLDPQFDLQDTSTSPDLNENQALKLSDLDQMLHAMEYQQRELESRLKETEHELGVSRRTGEPKEHVRKRLLFKENNHERSAPGYSEVHREPVRNITEQFHKEQTWKQGDNRGSVPDRGMGMRDILYEEPVENIERYKKEKPWKQGEIKGSVPDHGMGMRDILYDEPRQVIEEQVHKEKVWKQSSMPNHPREAHSSKVKQWKQDSNRYSNLNAQNVLYCQPPKPSDNYSSVLKENLTTLTVADPATSDSARNSESVYTDKSPSPSSSDSTQLTAYQNRNIKKRTTRDDMNTDSDSDKIHSNAMKVLNQHKNLLLHSSIKNTSSGSSPKHSKHSSSPKGSVYSYKNDQEKSPDYELSKRHALALVSLSELWNQTTGIGDLRANQRSKFLNKLQEEKLRRQHCEQLIQQLQTRTLELQERLAVAVQVDQAKDSAILRIHKSWEEAAAKIDNLRDKNSTLEQQIVELKASITRELAEATKKVNHYESEASKALNIAHSSQEKLTLLEKQNAQLTADLQIMRNKLNVVQDNYTAEVGKAQQLAKMSTQKEIELNENKIILSDARKEVAQSKKAVEICQTELTAMRTAQTHLELQLNQELNRVKEFEKEKKKLQVEIERHKKIEKTLQDDVEKQKEANEKNKLELRNFYQDQVEIVVREKLQEFQTQLEKAENSLQDELRKRELAVAKAAAIHIQQLTEKHALEIHLLEEKHKEEVKLYKLQLSQTQQQIENLHIKFQQHQERRGNIAQQLHKIMEVQWLEILKIINTSKSPVISQDKSTNTLDQLNSLKSKSYNNVEEILLKEEQRDKASGDFKIRKSNMPFFQSLDSISPIENDSRRKDDVLEETPLSTRFQKNRQQMDNELQRYVQMLLNKSPGNPTDENQDRLNAASLDNQQDDQFGNWHQGSHDRNPDGTKSNKIGLKERSGKPPWK